MQIDPLHETFNDPVELPHTDHFPELEEQRKVLDEAMKNGQIVAISRSEVALHKLQDDLRKAGYKKAK